MSRQLLTAGLLAAVLGGLACHRAPPPRPTTAAVKTKPASGGKPDSTAKSGGMFGSVLKPATKTGVATTPQVGKLTPKPGPRPGSPAIIRERVVSSLPYPNDSLADDDVHQVAVDTVERRLAALDPPVQYRPTLEEVKADFVRRDTRTIRPADPAEEARYAAEYARFGVPPKLMYVEYDVEVTADQIREIRTRERVADALRVFGGLVAVALTGFLFVRADDWTKGYLTRWLAAAAIAVLAGAVAALYFV